jgi:hypothetical protein
LLDAEVGVDGGITGSAGEVFPLAIWYVLAITLDISLSQSEVYQEDLVGRFVKTYAEIVRLDVAVDEVPVMNILNSIDHLID